MRLLMRSKVLTERVLALQRLVYEDQRWIRRPETDYHRANGLEEIADMIAQNGGRKDRRLPSGCRPDESM